MFRIAQGLFLAALFSSIFPGCRPNTGPRAEGESQEALTGRIYVTRTNLEPDKLASIWLLRRFVDDRAQFRFVGDDVPLTNGIPFDAPEAEFRRYATLSCFESILKKYPVRDPAVLRLAGIVHEVEINYWDTSLSGEPARLRRELQAVILARKDGPEACLAPTFAVMDAFLATLRRATNAGQAAELREAGHP